MDSPAQAFSASNSDPIHGIVSVEVWCSNLPGKVLPAAGAIVVVHLSGLGGVSQTFGRQTGKLILDGVLSRARAAIPAGAALFTNAANMLFIWAPRADEHYSVSLSEHLRKSIGAAPMALPNGEQIYPRLIIAHLLVAEGEDAEGAFQHTERILTQSAEFLAPPQAMVQSLPVREAFDNRLNALRLFARKGILESIIARLQLPARHPATVIIYGPHQVGKERVMQELQELLRKHHLPLAHHTCLERDNDVPGALLIQILLQLLDAFPAESLVPRLSALLANYPWLPVRLPKLGAKGAETRPGDITEFIAGLRDLLLALTRMLPCIAVIDGLQFADAPSMNELVEMQNRTDHALRLIASIEPQEYPLPEKLRTLMQTDPLIIRLPLYTREEVHNYLHNFSATLPTEEVVDALYQESNGAPLLMEETLRHWLDEGKLLFQQNLWSTRLAEPAEQLIPILADKAPEDEGKMSQVIADLLTPEELDRRINTMLALRILGLHLRLYPDNSSLVVNALQDVQRLLSELPDFHAIITVSFDGAEISVDGHPLSRRELQLLLKDFRNWFLHSMLGELQIERGISDAELILFLRTLATYDETKADRPLVEILRGLALPHVRYKTLQEASTAKVEGSAGIEADVNQLLIILGHMLASEAAPDNPLVKKLLAELSVASIMHKRAMMEALLRELHARKHPPIPATLNHLFLQSLVLQDDPVVLADVLVIMEQVFTWLLQQQQWDKVALLLEAVCDRLQHEADETSQHALTAFLVAAGNPTTLAPLLYYRSDMEELPDAIRRIYILLGQKALASLEYAIKNTENLTEYPHMVAALRLYRKEERDQLAQSLREPGNRMTIINLLHVLAAAGSTATLGAIEEKLPHNDPGVRIAALDATVNIAGAGAVGVVINALADKDTAVRARAVVLAGKHPQEGARDALVKLSHLETDEDVLATLCQTLAIFKDSHARDALLHLFQTSRYSDRVRVAACQALAIFRSELVVHAALHNAAAENSPRISIAARGVLHGE